MDPSHSQYSYQSYMNLLQNQPPQHISDTSQYPQYYFYPPQPTNSNMWCRPPMGSSGGVDSGNDMSQFSTQIGLENIKLDEGQSSTKKKTKTRASFSQEEDTLLFQSWLNISKDSIVGVDQKSDGFWNRVRDNYNIYRNQLPKKETGQIKARYHRLNGRIQKFVGCYKSALNQNKSGRSENDVLAEAHRIYAQDTKKKFLHVHAWMLLKDEPKWKGDAIENFSKRTKVSSSGGYTTSSNPGTPIECSDYEQPSPVVRPMGQKAAKRKSKGKAAMSSTNVDLSVMEKVAADRNVIMLRMAEAREKEAEAREREAKARESENETKWYEILIKDTTTMNERQLQDHEFCCSRIRQKLGMN
jgi:hypothetical protein